MHDGPRDDVQVLEALTLLRVELLLPPGAGGGGAKEPCAIRTQPRSDADRPTLSNQDDNEDAHIRFILLLVPPLVPKMSASLTLCHLALNSS